MMTIFSCRSLNIIWLLLICLGFTSAFNQSAPYKLVKVTTTLGAIVGKQIDNINYFLGIPFAEPPIGKYRFHPSAPKRPWFPSIYKAFNFSCECLQSSLHAPENLPRDEDCLYLNIWQPANMQKGVLLPVMVWIYGGGFLHGSASRPYYWGDKLARREVIVVSLNYRVGALGFLVSTSDGLFGNYGLHDQKLALEWVQDNIRKFQGDSRRVTLFGESAGAMSTALHFLDQQYRELRLQPRRRLFSQIILQSNPMGYKYRTVVVANFIGEAYKEQLDCEDLRCLLSEPADELIHVQDTLMAVPRSMGDFFTWGPVVTDSSYYRETRLASTPVADVTVHQPLEMLRQLKKLHIPVILGNNADEGTMFVFSAFPARMAKVVFQAYILSFFRASAPGVLRLYTKLIKKVDDSPYPDYRIPLSTIIGDYLFRCPNKLFASLLAQTPISTPVFLYEFALPTRVQGFPSCDGLSCHTVEIPYVFNLVDMVVQENIWKPSEIDVGSALSDSLGDDDVDVDLSSTEAYHRRPSHIESSTVESRGGKVDSNSRSDQRYNPQHNPSGSANQTTNDSRYISPDTYEKEEEWARYNMAKKGTQNFNLFSMPDIFGATQALFQKRRMQSPVITANIDDDSLIGIHIQVSDHMAHFWTTFARFGDPNGQRSADNNNGYVNRDDTSEPSPPFWPSVLGALPYIPPDTYYVSDEDVSDSSSSGNSELDGNYKWKPRRDRQFQQMLQHWNSTRRDRQSTSNTQSRPISTRISSRKDDTKDNIERAQNIKSNDDHIVSVAKQSSGAEDSNTFQPPFKKFLGLFPKLFVEYPDEDDDESSESDENSISISTGDRHSKNADTQSRTSPSSSEWIGFRNGGVQIDLRRLFHRHDDDEGQGDQEGEEPTSNTDSTEGSESVTQTGRDGIAKIKAIGEQSVPEAVDITFEGSSHETHPQMHRDIPVRGSNTPSSMKLALPRSNNRVVSIPAGLEVSGEEVHVMVFDEATGSSIIGEDCVCKFWNHLQYRF